MKRLYKSNSFPTQISACDWEMETVCAMKSTFLLHFISLFKSYILTKDCISSCSCVEFLALPLSRVNKLNMEVAKSHCSLLNLFTNQCSVHYIKDIHYACKAKAYSST